MPLNRRNFIKTTLATSMFSYTGSMISTVSASENLAPLNMGMETDILLIIDVQNDFCPGGSLAVKEGNKIIKNINSIQEKFKNVVLTQDWHPKNHSSFVTEYKDKEVFSSIKMPYGNQTIWPSHCVQGTNGAEFHKDLNTLKANTIIRKGFRREIDSYSAFWENDRVTPTGLEGNMKSMGIKRVFVCGLALDFCVGFSAIDAARLNFDVSILKSLCCSINLDGSLESALTNMKNTGVKIDG